MRTLIIICLMVLFVAGCATSTMQSEKVMPDGSVVKYKVVINSLFQDFKGSDLAATLNPEGETTVKAGTVDNTTNAMAADAIKELVSLVKEMLPLIAKTAITTTP